MFVPSFPPSLDTKPQTYAIAKKKAKVKAKEKDKGAQLTAQDFIDAGQQPPMVGANEKPDDGSNLKEGED